MKKDLNASIKMLVVFAINAIVDIHFQMVNVFFVNQLMQGARAVLMEEPMLVLLAKIA